MRKPIHDASLMLTGLFLLGGCASLPPGWDEYRSAMKCHFQGKDAECDKDYQKAIAKNDKLTGVHASYGAHLLKRGEVEPAQEQFKKEIENHPISETAVNLAFKNARHREASILPMPSPSTTPTPSSTSTPKKSGGK